MTPAQTSILLAAMILIATPLARAEGPAPVSKRIPWVTSHITGTPDPLPPYRSRRLFEKLTFKLPVDFAQAPGGDRWFVVEQGGLIYSFTGESERPDLVLDLTKQLKTLDRVPQAGGVGGCFGIAFHPDFAHNHYCYVFYLLTAKKPGDHLPNGTRVSRFTLTDASPPKAIPESEVVILDWLEGGHNGGCLKFGHDGYLYISAGDGEVPSPPDPRKTGQDLSDLLSSIIRIDVDHPGPDKPYSVPADNPFLQTSGARAEVWAYGMRNPWRMSFDRHTGQLWVGDVGWESWEMVYRVERGGNYGWSVVEGPLAIDPGGKRGPTPILPPAVSVPHPESVSITGGCVYRGSRLPALAGHYIYGDWETRRIWANKVDGKEMGPRTEIAHTDLRIIAFAEDHGGELYILDYEGGGVHELVPSDAASASTPFPRRLTDTGLFTSVKDYKLAPGVVPFAINSPQWADGAAAERFVAVPGDGAVVIRDNPSMLIHGKEVAFPKDSVLGRTYTLGTDRGPRRVETQILHFDGRGWNGYTYAWNDEQTDGDLVEAGGLSRVVPTPDPDVTGGVRKLLWDYAARVQCAVCHNAWAKFTLGYTEAQLDRDDDYGGANRQIRKLHEMGLAPQEWADRARAGQVHALADPADGTAPLDRRARSYLHANCSHCHQFGGGGAAVIDLRFDGLLKDTKMHGVAPLLGTFGIREGQIICPGDPDRSVLFYRMARLGPGRMPHIGSRRVDKAGLDLVEGWIGGAGSAGEATAAWRARERAAVAKLCNARGWSDELHASAELLLATTSGALEIVRAIDHGSLTPAVRQKVVDGGLASNDDAVRSLFERFNSVEPRTDLLGDAIDPQKLLAIPGSAERGRKVFFESAAGAACRTCHRIGGNGGAFGPDLSLIAAKYASRAEILTQILEPSKRIDEPYVLYQVLMKDGTARAGFVIERGDSRIAIQDAAGQRTGVARGQVERMDPQPVSAMPPGLLRAMTPQEAADILSFLSSLK